MATALLNAPNQSFAGEDHCHPFPDNAQLSVDSSGRVRVVSGQEELKQMGYDLDGFSAVLDFEGKTDALIATMEHDGGHIDVGTFSSERMGKHLDGYEVTPCREDVKAYLKERGFID